MGSIIELDIVNNADAAEIVTFDSTGSNQNIAQGGMGKPCVRGIGAAVYAIKFTKDTDGTIVRGCTIYGDYTSGTAVVRLDR